MKPSLALDIGRIATARVASVPPDLRLLSLGSKLKAYWDVRPAVSGATASLTLSSTLQGQGTSPPTVTITGSLSTPRHVVITYEIGGAIGTMKYRMVVYGNTPSDPYTLYNAVSVDRGDGKAEVDIGGGNTIVFGVGPYNADNVHAVQCTSWGELTGLANASLTDALSGVGVRYESYGLNSTTPCLRGVKSPSALANTTGVPTLASGNDVHLRVHVLGEGAKHISGTGASIIWGFSQSGAANTTKSYIRKVATGPTNTNASRWLLQRRDSSASPATAQVVSDGNSYADLDPYVFTDIVSASAQIHRNGMPCRSADVNLDRGVATTLDRFSIFNINLGTTGFTTALQYTGRIAALAITDDTITAAEQLLIWKAYAGVAA